MSAGSQERTFRLAAMTPLRRESTCGGNSNSWEVLSALQDLGLHTTMGGEGAPTRKGGRHDPGPAHWRG